MQIIVVDHLMIAAHNSDGWNLEGMWGLALMTGLLRNEDGRAGQ